MFIYSTGGDKVKIEYIVNNKGELYDFKTSEEEAEIEEFKIPSIVNGIKVKSIGDLSYTFSNLYDHGVEKIKKLIIEKGIKKIASFAFSDIDIEIDTVYWAKSCTVIPSHCFNNSNIRNIEGIEQVNKIESFAFSSMPLKKFSWPQNCKIIPHSCFAWSTIEAIIGIEDVEEIEYCAFYGTQLKRFSWPEKCKEIPNGCFYGCTELTTIEGIEQVYRIEACAFGDTPLKRFSCPENVSATGIVSFLDDCDNLEEIIFEGTGIKDIDLECLRDLKNVKKIDLSRCGAVNLLNATDPKYAEVKGKLILPYYVTEIN